MAKDLVERHDGEVSGPAIAQVFNHPPNALQGVLFTRHNKKGAFHNTKEGSLLQNSLAIASVSKIGRQRF
jgi:hypothetical protein